MAAARLFAAQIEAFPLDLLDYGVVRPAAVSGRPVVGTSRPRCTIVSECWMGEKVESRSESDRWEVTRKFQFEIQNQRGSLSQRSHRDLYLRVLKGLNNWLNFKKEKTRKFELWIAKVWIPSAVLELPGVMTTVNTSCIRSFTSYGSETRVATLLNVLFLHTLPICERETKMKTVWLVQVLESLT